MTDKNRLNEWTIQDEEEWSQIEEIRRMQDRDNSNFYQDDEVAMWNKEISLVEAQKRLADRKNSGKPQYSLLDLKCLEPCVRALEYGANKYTRNGWKKGFKLSALLDSLMRHITDLQDGKTIDEESGLSVVAHIQANAFFLGNTENNIDDLSNKEK